MLTHINTVPGGEDPAHISTDKVGKLLLTAYYVAGKVTVHRIGDDGALSTDRHATVKTKAKAHAAVLDPWEMGVLVPHTAPNVIYALRWHRGDVSDDPFPNDRIMFDAPKGAEPRHVVFHPTLMPDIGFPDAEKHVAYVVDEHGSSVTKYDATLNAISWWLSPKQSISSIPATFRGNNACAEIRLHPTNRFLYVSNRGHDSIATFAVYAKTGDLTSRGQTSTEKAPRSFDIEPAGKFLCAAGESSGKLAAYRIDQTLGKLERFASYDVGNTPWWVMAIALPAATP